MNWAYIWCGMFVLMLAWHIVERKLIVRTCKRSVDSVVAHAELECERLVEMMLQLVDERSKGMQHGNLRDLYMAKLKGREG